MTLDELKELTKDERKNLLENVLCAHVAAQVRALRGRHEMTRAQFGKFTKTSTALISKLENGGLLSVSVSTLEKIAIACNVGLLVRFTDWLEFLRLMDDDGSIPPPSLAESLA